MQNQKTRPSAPDTAHMPVDPDLPSLGAILIGTVLFLIGGTLLFTVIGKPLGILLFAAGLGLTLEPRRGA